MDGDINIIHGNENCYFAVKLQSRKLKRKTAMIVREVPYATRSSP